MQLTVASDGGTYLHSRFERGSVNAPPYFADDGAAAGVSCVNPGFCPEWVDGRRARLSTLAAFLVGGALIDGKVF
ncbi:hypothetical protein ACWGR3_30710, partial [Streptomyces albidoflavus]